MELVNICFVDFPSDLCTETTSLLYFLWMNKLNRRKEGGKARAFIVIYTVNQTAE